MKQRQRGFNLIELMLTVAVIAVLAGVAIPLYQEYILRSKRNACQAVMVATAGVFERRHSANNSYEKSGVTGNPNSQDHLPGDKAEDRPRCPESGPTSYSLTIGGVTDSTWTVTATPVSGQKADKCGVLAINNLGQKFASGPLAGGSAPAIDFAQDPGTCW
jgi:type IV pilus assembly protein PilE